MERNKKGLKDRENRKEGKVKVKTERIQKRCCSTEASEE